MALSANKTDIGLNTSGITMLRLANSQTIYQGAMVTTGTTTGLARPADDAANRQFVGIALHYAKSGASGETWVAVQTQGEFEVKTSGGDQDRVGNYAYCVDDDEVDTDGTAPTNKVIAGTVARHISATRCVVRMGAAPNYAALG